MRKWKLASLFDAFLSRVSNKLLPERNGEGGVSGNDVTKRHDKLTFPYLPDELVLSLNLFLLFFIYSPVCCLSNFASPFLIRTNVRKSKKIDEANLLSTASCCHFLTLHSFNSLSNFWSHRFWFKKKGELFDLSCSYQKQFVRWNCCCLELPTGLLGHQANMLTHACTAVLIQTDRDCDLWQVRGFHNLGKKKNNKNKRQHCSLTCSEPK